MFPQNYLLYPPTAIFSSAAVPASPACWMLECNRSGAWPPAANALLAHLHTHERGSHQFVEVGHDVALLSLSLSLAQQMQMQRSPLSLSLAPFALPRSGDGENKNK